MEKSKLVFLMSSLTKIEVEQFIDYVKSPFFNKKKQQVKLASYLKKCHPEYPQARLTKVEVFKKLYPGEVYDDNRMRYEMSDLTKLLEDFLAFQNYKQNSILNEINLLQSLSNKKLDKYFEQTHKKAISKLEDQQSKNSMHYFHFYQLNNLADQHFSQKGERKFDINIQNASHYLDLFYLSQKLRNCCSMADRQKFLASKYDVNFLEELNTMLEKVNFQNVQDIEVYDKLYQFINKENSDQDFYKIIDLLKTHVDFLEFNDQKEIFMYLINYCARKIRGGDENFVETTLELYLNGIQSKVLFEEGFLSPWTFKNIVSLGLRSKQYLWVKQFISEYSDSIKPQFRQDALNFNLADLSFHQNEFKQTLSFLNQLKYSDIYYKINGRVLLLKTYFHLDEMNPLLSGIASFTIYLKRNNQITKDVKKSYLNFCNLLFRIVKAKPQKRFMVLEKIKNTEQVISKAWLNSVCQNETAY